MTSDVRNEMLQFLNRKFREESRDKNNCHTNYVLPNEVELMVACAQNKEDGGVVR